MLLSCKTTVMNIIYIVPENRQVQDTVLNSTKSSATATRHWPAGMHHHLRSSLKKKLKGAAVKINWYWVQVMCGICVSREFFMNSGKGTPSRCQGTNSYPSELHNLN